MKKVSIEKIFGSELKEIMRLLRSSGKECYIVGGAIRDLLLGYEKFIDIDLTTSLSVEKMKQIFDRNKIRFDDRALKYGCLTISNQKKRTFQITSFRKDIQTFGRAADIEPVENIEEDAKRRDFTINAFYCSYDGQIIDPLGNLEDLNKIKLDFIGDPEIRIKEDYLRILRFFRFIAVLDLKDENLVSKNLPIIRKHIDGISDLSYERVASEIRKILLARSPSFALKLMNKVDLYKKLLGIYSQGALLKLEELENRFNLTPSLVRRLLALEIKTSIPLMIKKEKKYFNQLSNLMDLDHNPDYLGYKVGEKASLDLLIIKEVKEGFIIKTKDIEKIKNASKKNFPIKFSDVHPLTKNLNITKDKMNLMEKFWINSGFKASKEKLLSLLS
jgi:poly(A) polymerase